MKFTIYVIGVDQPWVAFLASDRRFWEIRFLWGTQCIWNLLKDIVNAIGMNINWQNQPPLIQGGVFIKWI